MDPIILGIIALNIAVVGGGLAWRYWFSERARYRRLLKKAPRVPIAQAGEGALVRITGMASAGAGGVLTAPLSGRPCLVLEVEVDENVHQGKSSSWKNRIREIDFVPEFWVEDETGRALIRLDYPKLALTQDAKFNSGVLNDPEPRLVEFLESHGESPQGWVFNKALRYREGVLEPDEEVTVLGVVRREPDPDPMADSEGYRQRAMRVVLRSPADGDLVISDAPGLVRRP